MISWKFRILPFYQHIIFKCVGAINIKIKRLQKADVKKYQPGIHTRNRIRIPPLLKFIYQSTASIRLSHLSLTLFHTTLEFTIHSTSLKNHLQILNRYLKCNL